MRITSYGLFWRADEIDWEPDSKRTLLGRKGKRSLQICDFDQQEAVYILYNDYGPFYVGLTEKRGLGRRLRSHYHLNHRKGKWDRFSWFGFKDISDKPAKLGICELMNGDDAVVSSKRTTIGDLEAVLIAVMGLSENRRKERLSEARSPWLQLSRSERIARY